MPSPQADLQAIVASAPPPPKHPPSASRRLQPEWPRQLLGGHLRDLPSSTKTVANANMNGTPSRFLALPYDIRYLIYQQLFPSTKHIYIQAGSNSLIAINESRARLIPAALLRTSRQINIEAGQFLYTNYLFHIVGLKESCLANYEALEQTLRKYGKSRVYVHPLSNGVHSHTGAILLHVGDARLASIKARGRGMPTSIEAMREEAGFDIARRIDNRRRCSWYFTVFWSYYGAEISRIMFALAVVLLAVLLSGHLSDFRIILIPSFAGPSSLGAYLWRVGHVWRW